MKKTLTLGCALVLLPLVAQAQDFDPKPGFYVGFGGGPAWNLATTSSIGGTITSSTGFAVGGLVGYDFVGPRVSLEASYGQVHVNANLPRLVYNGPVRQITIMAKVLYDFFPASAFTPYLGGGAGVAFIDSNTPFGDTQFAYQGILGLGWNVDSQWRIAIEGRYQGTTNPNVNAGGVNITYGNNNLAAIIGAQYKFPAAVLGTSAVAPPAPAPAPPSFMVFFDFDRSDLSAQAQNTIQQAANAYKTKGNARVTTTGHADRSGPDAYNMALSLRRANAVKDALVRNGVPATVIAVVGRGEAMPLVQTADGVREPRNRRVEIVMQ